VLTLYLDHRIPTPLHLAASVTAFEDDDMMVDTSNTSSSADSVPQHTFHVLVKSSLAVADTGATSCFLTKDAPCQNKQCAVNPISVTLSDGEKITSTHVYDVTIPGLPTVLTGHIMPGMTSAFLFGIRVLCKAGCTVIFGDNKCQVIYNNKNILTGYKDPTSNLRTLPILPIDEA
jgi:hypothetical protein